MKKLLLVDLENKHKVDLSRLDESYRAIIFVGANQNAPKASKQPATDHRFSRVDFLKISGAGKNALDFHIAFELGRTFETDSETQCFVLSGDKGFDPLLNHLNSNGMSCQRIESIEDLVSTKVLPAISLDRIVCPYCKKASTVEHHGGYWCSNCGRFAVPPDSSQLPSNQAGFRDNRFQQRQPLRDLLPAEQARAMFSQCGWCHQRTDMTGGIYDDGEWMCRHCIDRYAR